MDSIKVRRARWELEELIAQQEFSKRHPICSEDGCDRATEALDLCRVHARRHRF